jgi:hypothetical protein
VARVRELRWLCAPGTRLLQPLVCTEVVYSDLLESKAVHGGSTPLHRPVERSYGDARRRVQPRYLCALQRFARRPMRFFNYQAKGTLHTA